MSQCPFTIPPGSDPGVRTLATNLSLLQFFVNSGDNLAVILAKGGWGAKTKSNATESLYIRGDEQWTQSEYDTSSRAIVVNHINATTNTTIETSMVPTFTQGATSGTLTAQRLKIDAMGHVTLGDTETHELILSTGTWSAEDVTVVTGVVQVGDVATINSQEVTVLAAGATSSGTISLGGGSTMTTSFSETAFGSTTVTSSSYVPITTITLTGTSDLSGVLKIFFYGPTWVAALFYTFGDTPCYSTLINYGSGSADTTYSYLVVPIPTAHFDGGTGSNYILKAACGPSGSVTMSGITSVRSFSWI